MRPVVIGALCLAVLGCRAEEDRVSGQPYSCLCEVEGGAERDAAVCGLDAGEAIQTARECVPDARFCYCEEDTITWCELGDCDVH